MLSLKISSIEPGAQHLALSTFPEFWKYNLTGIPLDYKGHYKVSFSVFTLILVFVAIFHQPKKVYGWVLASVFLYLIELNFTLFYTLWKFFGMNFSRLLPPTAALIPVTILSAFGAEALISRGLQKQPFKPLLGAIVVTATLLAIVILSGFIFNNNVFSGNMNGTVIFLIVFVICLFCLQVTKTKPFLLFLGMVIPAIFFQQPMMLQQDRQTLIHSSPVITELKKHLPEDSRFASVSPELNFYLQIETLFLD